MQAVFLNSVPSGEVTSAYFCFPKKPIDVDMEVLCVNGKFPSPVLAFYAQFGVQIPKEDTIYTVRQVKRHTTGETGVLLAEIQNPDVPVRHPVLGETWFEPTFNLNRFRNLLGEPVREEEEELKMV